MTPRLSRVLVAVSVALFAAAVASPVAVYTDGPRNGLYMLTLGWVGPMLMQFGWYGNPLLLASWIFGALARPRWARVRVRLAWAGLVLAGTSLLSMPWSEMADNEMRGAPFVRFHVGVFVWLAAFVVDVVSAQLGRPRPPRG